MTFFDDFIYQDVIFHYNIAKVIFSIILKGTEYGRSEKSTVLRSLFLKKQKNFTLNTLINDMICYIIIV